MANVTSSSSQTMSDCVKAVLCGEEGTTKSLRVGNSYTLTVKVPLKTVLGKMAKGGHMRAEVVVHTTNPRRPRSVARSMLGSRYMINIAMVAKTDQGEEPIDEYICLLSASSGNVAPFNDRGTVTFMFNVLGKPDGDKFELGLRMVNGPGCPLAF